MAAAEDGLYTVLSGLAGLQTPPVPISRAHPLDGLQREHIWISGAVTATQEWELTGSGSQAKLEEIPFDVFVRTGDADYVTARDRALYLGGQIETTLRTDPHVGVPNAVWDSDVTAMEKDAWSEESGWVVMVRVAWRVRAWLS
jgi:hypothetical protein